MKVLLFMLVPLLSLGDEPCIIVKPLKFNKEFRYKSKFTQKEKTIHCIIAQTALFAVGEYAIQTRNKKLWGFYGRTFVASIPLSVIYLHKHKRR